MAKLSQLDKAIANLCAKRDVLDAAIEELEAQKTPPAKEPKVVRKVRKLGAVMDDRPAS